MFILSFFHFAVDKGLSTGGQKFFILTLILKTIKYLTEKANYYVSLTERLIS